MNQKEAAARAQGASEDVVQAQLVPGPDDPLPMTEDEVLIPPGMLRACLVHRHKKRKARRGAKGEGGRWVRGRMSIWSALSVRPDSCLLYVVTE